MTDTTYRWRVLKDGTSAGMCRMVGKVIGWRMDEQTARMHAHITGRVLEKVQGSEEAIRTYDGRYKPLTLVKDQ